MSIEQAVKSFQNRVRFYNISSYITREVENPTGALIERLQYAVVDMANAEDLEDLIDPKAIAREVVSEYFRNMVVEMAKPDGALSFVLNAREWADTIVRVAFQ